MSPISFTIPQWSLWSKKLVSLFHLRAFSLKISHLSICKIYGGQRHYHFTWNQNNKYQEWHCHCTQAGISIPICNARKQRTFCGTAIFSRLSQLQALCLNLESSTSDLIPDLDSQRQNLLFLKRKKREKEISSKMPKDSVWPLCRSFVRFNSLRNQRCQHTRIYFEISRCQTTTFVLANLRARQEQTTPTLAEMDFCEIWIQTRLKLKTQQRSITANLWSLQPFYCKNVLF